MKIKTSEATGLRLDWGSSFAMGYINPRLQHVGRVDGRQMVRATHKDGGSGLIDHTDPDLCAWLIEQHGIASTRKTFSLGYFWECKVLDAGSESHYIVLHGKTLPEAVARCVIAMKLGDEFECPDELGVMS